MFQFASEEYSKDLELLSYNIYTYFNFAKLSRMEFLKSSPIEKSLHKLMEELRCDDINARDSASQSSSTTNTQSGEHTSINKDSSKSHQSSEFCIFLVQ